MQKKYGLNTDKTDRQNHKQDKIFLVSERKRCSKTEVPDHPHDCFIASVTLINAPLLRLLLRLPVCLSVKCVYCA